MGDLKNQGEGFKRNIVLIIGLLLLLLLITSPAAAQNYRFAVDEMKMQVFVQPDASARIMYDITFSNGAFAHPIDIVDIGMPHEDYDIGNMVAAVNGVEITGGFAIQSSEFVKPGVEIHLGPQSIPASERGTLHFEFTMPDMVFQDVTRRDYASLQITPTWFGDEFVTGTTRLQIAIYMLPEVKPDELLYQQEPFTNKGILQERPVAAWEFPNTRLTGPHLVGVSFPTRGMERVVSMNVFQLAVRWFENSPNARIIAGLISIILFSFLFFRFSGGTGYSVWVVLLAGQIYLYFVNPAAHLLSFPFLIALLLLNEGRLRRRKRRYLPAVAQVEGGGIKRGLTAPEAAALLELPVNKVLTLIIFGLLKKGVLRQVQDTPLVVEVVEEFRAQDHGRHRRHRDAYRRKVAQKQGIVLHKYEHGFLETLEAKSKRPLHEIDLSAQMKGFLQHVASRVQGFDLSDTQAYYRRIVERALTEATAIGEIPEREKVVDRNLEWILMSGDDDYRPVFESGDYQYRPVWTRPVTLPRSGGASPLSRPASAQAGPSFGDVAAGFAGWAENTMGNMASAIMPESLSVESAGGKTVDLSGFDRVTGDILEALASSSGGSGGGGGGCACACAGCACACACAGGGR